MRYSRNFCLRNLLSLDNRFRIIRFRIVLIETRSSGYRRGNLRSRQCCINIHAPVATPSICITAHCVFFGCNCSIVLWSKWPRDAKGSHDVMYDIRWGVWWNCGLFLRYDGKLSPPPTTPCNTRGATGVLPALKMEIDALFWRRINGYIIWSRYMVKYFRASKAVFKS